MDPSHRPEPGDLYRYELDPEDVASAHPTGRDAHGRLSCPAGVWTPERWERGRDDGRPCIVTVVSATHGDLGGAVTVALWSPLVPWDDDGPVRSGKGYELQGRTKEHALEWFLAHAKWLGNAFDREDPSDRERAEKTTEAGKAASDEWTAARIEEWEQIAQRQRKVK